MHWYRASKVMAEKASWKFVEDNDVSFDLVTINPPMIIGPWLPHYRRNNESSMVLKDYLTGAQPPGRPARPAARPALRGAWVSAALGCARFPS